MTLDGVKVGDRLAVPQEYSAGDRVVTVTRVTAKTAFCGDAGFRISDGLKVGSGASTWHRTYARFATPDDVERQARIILIDKIQRISRDTVKHVTTPALRAAWDLLKPAPSASEV